ncbi:MAG: glycoside hydrolase family 28 protein [Myxococcales bacterium]|nr:glycoside hydrolase family 28 protein [Myxococcales bacterium]
MSIRTQVLSLLSLSSVLLVSFECSAAEPVTAASLRRDWHLAERIVDSIAPPRIPSKDYSIVDYGAHQGDEKDDRVAIIKTIWAASKGGGGRVVLPRGRWLSNGPIHLASSIDFHLEKGAVLLFGPNANDYLPLVFTRWEGTEAYNYSPLIYARNVHDVAISGEGTIDGNAESEFHGWIKRQRPDMDRLRLLGNSHTDVASRRFGRGHYLRPSLIQLIGAERVRIEGVMLLNSPFWVNHLVYTDHAVIRGVSVRSMWPNNDGVDVDSSSNVLIEKCHFRTGDDSVVIKSGRDLDGRRIGRRSENIVVRHNDMGGEDGIALGSEMSGGIRNVFFTDNVLRKGASAIRFKANLDRGGVVEHIRVRNMKIESFDRLFWFQLNYPGLLGGKHPSVYRDIVFQNFVVQKVGTLLEVHAPKQAPLTEVVFDNIVVESAEKNFILENVGNIALRKVHVGGRQLKLPKAK